MAVASLPMYDLPELREATDAWWRGLARAFAAEGLEAVPEALERGPSPDGTPGHWRDPDLLFGQTCGYPLTHGLDATLQLVATPRYAAEGCEGADYCSLFVVRRDENAAELGALAGRRAAFNARDSQSGYNCLRAAVARLAGGRPFFSELVETGGHAASLAAVAEERADLAAVDCVTFALLARHAPRRVAGLRVLARSEPAPALPYVTAARRPPEELERLLGGLRRACADPALAEVREALLIRGVERLPRAAYDRIDAMERAAGELDYPELR